MFKDEIHNDSEETKNPLKTLRVGLTDREALRW
jgi:hypothetical protein